MIPSTHQGLLHIALVWALSFQVPNNSFSLVLGALDGWKNVYKVKTRSKESRALRQGSLRSKSHWTSLSAWDSGT